MTSGAKVSQRKILAADLALLGVTLIWGLTFPVVKAALRQASPLLFNAVRMSVAGALLAALFRPRWRRLPGATWGAGAALGLFLAAGYALQTAGLQWAPPAVSAFLTSFSVILVPVLLALVWRRRLGWTAWLGAALALLGLYLLVGGGGGGPALGVGLTLGCAVAFALQIILQGEWAPHIPFGDLAALQIVFAALFTWMAVPLVERATWHNTPGLWLAVGLTAVLATALAFSVQAWAQQFTPATHTAVVFAFEPVFAWLASVIGWHERLQGPQLAGAGLIVAAMLVVERGRNTVQS